MNSSYNKRPATIPAMVNIMGPTWTNISFTSLEVKRVLESLQLGKSSRPDGINNRIFKELTFSLSRPLSYWFSYSMSKGIFPDIWKEANVSPLLKKDDPPSRPISLLNTIGQVMEKIVHKHMFNFFTVWFFQAIPQLTSLLMFTIRFAQH